MGTFMEVLEILLGNIDKFVVDLEIRKRLRKMKKCEPIMGKI